MAGATRARGVPHACVVRSRGAGCWTLPATMTIKPIVIREALLHSDLHATLERAMPHGTRFVGTPSLSADVIFQHGIGVIVCDTDQPHLDVSKFARTFRLPVVICPLEHLSTVQLTIPAEASNVLVLPAHGVEQVVDAMLDVTRMQQQAAVAPVAIAQLEARAERELKRMLHEHTRVPEVDCGLFMQAVPLADAISMDASMLHRTHAPHIVPQSLHALVSWLQIGASSSD